MIGVKEWWCFMCIVVLLVLIGSLALLAVHDGLTLTDPPCLFYWLECAK